MDDNDESQMMFSATTMAMMMDSDYAEPVDKEYEEKYDEKSDEKLEKMLPTSPLPNWSYNNNNTSPIAPKPLLATYDMVLPPATPATYTTTTTTTTNTTSTTSLLPPSSLILPVLPPYAPPRIPLNANQERLCKKQQQLLTKTDQEIQKRFDRQPKKRQRRTESTSAPPPVPQPVVLVPQPPIVPQPHEPVVNSAYMTTVQKLAAMALRQLEEEHQEMRAKQVADCLIRLLDDPVANPLL